MTLGIANVILGDTESLFESSSETFLIGLVGIEISTGAIVSVNDKDGDVCMRNSQFVEGVGYLEDKNMREAVVLLVSTQLKPQGHRVAR